MLEHSFGKVCRKQNLNHLASHPAKTFLFKAVLICVTDLVKTLKGFTHLITHTFSVVVH